MAGTVRLGRRGAHYAENTSTASAHRRPPAGCQRGRYALPVVRKHGSSAHPSATTRSTAELGAPGVSLSLREPWLCLGRHRPTEMVHPGLASPPRPLMRSTGNANRRSAAWPSAGRRSPTIASSPFVCFGSISPLPAHRGRRRGLSKADSWRAPRSTDWLGPSSPRPAPADPAERLPRCAHRPRPGGLRVFGGGLVARDRADGILAFVAVGRRVTPRSFSAPGNAP